MLGCCHGDHPNMSRRGMWGMGVDCVGGMRRGASAAATVPVLLLPC